MYSFYSGVISLPFVALKQWNLDLSDAVQRDEYGKDISSIRNIFIVCNLHSLLHHTFTVLNNETFVRLLASKV